MAVLGAERRPSSRPAPSSAAPRASERCVHRDAAAPGGPQWRAQRGWSERTRAESRLDSWIWVRVWVGIADAVDMASRTTKNAGKSIIAEKEERVDGVEQREGRIRDESRVRDRLGEMNLRTGEREWTTLYEGLLLAQSYRSRGVEDTRPCAASHAHAGFESCSAQEAAESTFQRCMVWPFQVGCPHFGRVGVRIDSHIPVVVCRCV